MAIDGEWLRQRLTGERGEKARLAEALGVKQDVISKILSGTRRLTQHEAEVLQALYEGPSTEEERRLLAAWRRADEARRRLAMEIVLLGSGDAEAAPADRG